MMRDGAAAMKKGQKFDRSGAIGAEEATGVRQGVRTYRFSEVSRVMTWLMGGDWA